MEIAGGMKGVPKLGKTAVGWLSAEAGKPGVTLKDQEKRPRGGGGNPSSLPRFRPVVFNKQTFFWTPGESLTNEASA